MRARWCGVALAPPGVHILLCDPAFCKIFSADYFIGFGYANYYSEKIDCKICTSRGVMHYGLQQGMHYGLHYGLHYELH